MPPPHLPGYRSAMKVSVRCEPANGGWTCLVTIDDGRGAPSEHVVSVDAADLRRLAPLDATPGDLVRRSFAFLLAREPKESILGRFDLPLIGRYFPEYEREITGQGWATPSR
jgi:hypothetical protein